MVHSDPTPTILLAEDDTVLRELLHEQLEGQGFRVLSAPDGSAALELAERYAGTIDLLVSDYVMPRTGGLELATWLRARRPEMRVLFISGSAFDAGPPGPAAALGASFLAKPFTEAALIAKVREALGR